MKRQIRRLNTLPLRLKLPAMNSISITCHRSPVLAACLLGGFVDVETPLPSHPRKRGQFVWNSESAGACTAIASNLAPDKGHTTSSFGALRSRGLIDYPRAGMVAAGSMLFLEGAR